MLSQLLDGRYQVIRALSAGGFGQTYIAQDTRRPGNPTCVVKLLKPASSDPNVLQTARRLFQSEAETLEQLGNHDQIPRLLAYFEQDQEFYLVQEFIDGHTLTAELLPGQRWTETQTIQMLEDVLGILEFVHSRGVIHRDIKPDNLIRRTADNKLVLVDFGAVKQLRTQIIGSQGQMSATVAIGTPGYMPSEQGRGQPRPNSDIYALGIIGIQALTGLLPLQLQVDANTGEILWQHLVPVSLGLANVLSKMVQYHFKDRYQSATEALQALRQSNNPYPSVQYPTTAGYAPVVYAPTFNETLPTQPPPSASVQNTIPAAPANSYIPPVRPVPGYAPDSSSPNKLPLIVGTSIAAVVVAAMGMAIALNQGSFFNSNGILGKNNQAGNSQQDTCTVVIGTLNVRSGPSKDANRVDGIQKGTNVSLTGSEENGWVEISSPTKGWVFNDQQYIDCPTANNTPAETKTNTGSNNNSPSGSTDRGSSTLAKAIAKYQSGDLDGAIALAKSIPSSSSASGKAKSAIAQWQQDWDKAKSIVNEAQKAFNEENWDAVLAYNPETIPIQYWREQLAQLISQAGKKKAQTPKPSPTDSPEPTETPKPTDSPKPTETPKPTDSPKPTETPKPTDSPTPKESPE
ncbi:MAG: protein kinase [Aphanothece sp. CMT-3BRIN-NPC111]|jgi:serine/threonine-protein kinase|nr:protein kinase [Aphanothece sp. CMT-3BRIN-NPC111]